MIPRDDLGSSNATSALVDLRRAISTGTGGRWDRHRLARGGPTGDRRLGRLRDDPGLRSYGDRGSGASTTLARKTGRLRHRSQSFRGRPPLDPIYASAPSEASSRECRAKGGFDVSSACACAKRPRVAYALKRVDERVEKREKYLYRISNEKCDRERQHRNPWVKLLNRPTTVPAMRAIIKRARLE
jgi:hypothetical protein